MEELKYQLQINWLLVDPTETNCEYSAKITEIEEQYKQLTGRSIYLDL